MFPPLNFNVNFMVLVLVSPQGPKGAMARETSCTPWTKQPDLYLVPQLRFLLDSNVWPPAEWMTMGKGVGKLGKGNHSTGLCVRGAPLKIPTQSFSEPHLGRVLRGSESHPTSPPQDWKWRIRTYNRDRQTSRKLRSRMSLFLCFYDSFFFFLIASLSSLPLLPALPWPALARSPFPYSIDPASTSRSHVRCPRRPLRSQLWFQS